MENRKTTLLGFLGQMFMIYGITDILLNLFVLIFGEQAEGYSSIFSLGTRGVGCATCFEFLAAIAVLTALKQVVMSARFGRGLPSAVRTAMLFAGVLAVVLVFNAAFGWFPSDDIRAWVMFFACFAISCAASVGISALAARQENRKFDEALARLKEEEQ